MKKLFEQQEANREKAMRGGRSLSLSPSLSLSFEFSHYRPAHNIGQWFDRREPCGAVSPSDLKFFFSGDLESDV